MYSEDGVLHLTGWIWVLLANGQLMSMLTMLT